MDTQFGGFKKSLDSFTLSTEDIKDFNTFNVLFKTRFFLVFAIAYCLREIVIAKIYWQVTMGLLISSERMNLFSSVRQSATKDLFSSCSALNYSEFLMRGGEKCSSKWRMLFVFAAEQQQFCCNELTILNLVPTNSWWWDLHTITPEYKTELLKCRHWLLRSWVRPNSDNVCISGAGPCWLLQCTLGTKVDNSDSHVLYLQAFLVYLVAPRSFIEG